MSKLLLTSNGLANQKIKDKFLSLINKPVQQIKIIFIPTASRTAEELKYVAVSKQELLALGILEQNIKTLNLDERVLVDEVFDSDVLYVCGGNTFYLLQRVNAVGFAEVIKKFVALDKLYVGVSAGSILAGPDIGIAGPFDENDIGLKDFSGLNLTEYVISPHYQSKEAEIIRPFQAKFSVIPLADAQALVVVDGEKEII